MGQLDHPVCRCVGLVAVIDPDVLPALFGDRGSRLHVGRPGGTEVRDVGVGGWVPWSVERSGAATFVPEGRARGCHAARDKPRHPAGHVPGVQATGGFSGATGRGGEIVPRDALAPPILKIHA